jgi:SPP1 family predicted phage head-tail adaptor
MLTRLPYKIIVQTSTVSSADGGTFNETWSDTYTRWASVQVKSADENFKYDKTSQENDYEITMRSDVFTNKMRIKYNNKILSIKTVSDPTQYGHMIKVIANEELT